MKTWLSYLTAMMFGFATTLVLKDNAVFVSVLATGAEIVLRLGVIITFPLVFITMTASGASLRRNGDSTGKAWVLTLFWSLVTTVALSLCAALVFGLVPASFPVSSSQGTVSGMYEILKAATTETLEYADPLQGNMFLDFVLSYDNIIAIVCLSLLFGFALRPTNKIYYPAYNTVNSFSEVMMRLARTWSSLTAIFIFFLSGKMLEELIADGSLGAMPKFTFMVLLCALACILVVTPLAYVLFTGFKKNPYRQMFRLFPSMTAAFFSYNTLFAIPALYTDCRMNLGIQKKVIGKTVPLNNLFSRGGSAAMATLCCCALVRSISGQDVPFTAVVTIALVCTFMSYASALHLGYEVMFVTSFALHFLKIDTYDAEVGILALLPFLNGFGIMIDTFLAGLGTSVVANALKADCNICNEDIT